MTDTIEYDRIVDLSQEINPDLQVFPGYPRPTFVPWTRREVHGFLSEALFLVTHTGTHVDAPWHYRPEGKKLNELAVDRFVRPAHVLDLQCSRNRDRITADRLERAVRDDGVTIQHEDAILLRTGWEAKRGTEAFMHEYPGLTKEGAEWLVRAGVGLVGIDTASIDLPDSSDFPAHHTLLAADIPILENLTDLGVLVRARFTLIALPLPLHGATGSPIRAVALVKD